jgi:hypothetical protein
MADASSEVKTAARVGAGRVNSLGRPVLYGTTKRLLRFRAAKPTGGV